MLRRLSLGVLYLYVCVLQLVCSQSQCYDHDRLGGPIIQGCNSLVNHCLGKQTNEHLVGDSVELECGFSTALTFTVFKHSCGVDIGEPIVLDGGNYTMVNDRTLRIESIKSSDEGLYSCSNSAGDVSPISCVIVSGLARFATCDAPFPFTYSPGVVSSSNSCYEELNATEGRVTLDTRIMYSPGGCCNCREDINIFTIRLGSPTNPTIFYNCDDTPDSDCPANERVVVNRQSTLFYDFKVELQLNESDIAQLIYVASEVRQPGRSDFRYFWKIFSVTVHQDLTTTPPPPTTFPATTFPVTTNNTMTTNDGTTLSSLGEVGALVPIVPVSGGAVGGAVGAVVMIVLIVVAVIVIIAIVLQYQRQRTDSKDIENKKEEPAPLLEIIIMEIPQNTYPVDGPNRESVYNNDFEKHFSLQLILESKTSAKV